MCLYCVKYRIIAARLAESHRSPGHAMLCCLMVELTFAHVNTVLSLCDKFYNEPSSGKHCVECYECLTVKTRPVWGIINVMLPIFILCDNVVHYGIGGVNGWQHCTMGWWWHSAEWTQYTLSCGHCRGQDSCGEWETLLRVRAWECLEFGGQASVGPAQPRPEPETGGCTEAGAGLAPQAQAGPQSHTTTVALEISSEQLGAGVHVTTILPPYYTYRSGVNMWLGEAASQDVTGAAWHTVRRDSDWRVSGAMFLSFITQQGQCYFPFVQRVSTGPGLIIYLSKQFLISGIRESSLMRSTIKDGKLLALSVKFMKMREWVLFMLNSFDLLYPPILVIMRNKKRFGDFVIYWKHVGSENNRVTFMLLCCQLWCNLWQKPLLNINGYLKFTVDIDRILKS